MAPAGQWAPSQHGLGPDWRAAPRACPAANFANRQVASAQRPTPARRRGALSWGYLGKGGARARDACFPDRYWTRWGQKGRTGRSGKDERMERVRARSSASWVASLSGVKGGRRGVEGVKRPSGAAPSLLQGR